MSTRTGKGTKKALPASSSSSSRRDSPAEATAEANLIPPISEQGLDFVTLRKQRTLTMPEDLGKTTLKMEEELEGFILRIFHALPEQADSHPAILALTFDGILRWTQFRTLDRNDIDGLTLEGSHRKVELSQRYKQRLKMYIDYIVTHRDANPDVRNSDFFTEDKCEEINEEIQNKRQVAIGRKINDGAQPILGSARYTKTDSEKQYDSWIKSRPKVDTFEVHSDAATYTIWRGNLQVYLESYQCEHLIDKDFVCDESDFYAKKLFHLQEKWFWQLLVTVIQSPDAKCLLSDFLVSHDGRAAFFYIDEQMSAENFLPKDNRVRDITVNLARADITDFSGTHKQFIIYYFKLQDTFDIVTGSKTSYPDVKNRLYACIRGSPELVRDFNRITDPPPGKTLMEHLKITLLRDAEAIDDARRQVNPNSIDAIRTRVASHNVLDPFEQDLAVNNVFTPSETTPKIRLPDHLFEGLSRDKQGLWIGLDDQARQLMLDLHKLTTPSDIQEMISNRDDEVGTSSPARPHSDTISPTHDQQRNDLSPEFKAFFNMGGTSTYGQPAGRPPGQ